MAIEVHTTYEPYSHAPEYVTVNRALVEGIDLDSIRFVADLACGTGLLSEFLLERKPDLAICGVDLSAEQIDITSRAFAKKGLLAASLDELRSGMGSRRGIVCLNQGSADSLALRHGEIDLAIMGNAIHLMPDISGFLREVGRVLRRGGVFVFNTVFFAGTFPKGTESVYTEWLKQAVVILEEKNRALAAAGQPRIPRIRGRGGRAFSKEWLSEHEWRDRLEDSGFTVVHSAKREMSISRTGLALLGTYPGLPEALMSGYPVEIASACLQEAAGRAFDNLNLAAVPRYWLEVSAVKR